MWEAAALPCGVEREWWEGDEGVRDRDRWPSFLEADYLRKLIFKDSAISINKPSVSKNYSIFFETSSF